MPILRFSTALILASISQHALSEQAKPAEDIEVLSDVQVVAEPMQPQLEESAQAVQVIETEQAQFESADLGEILSRQEGINIRRNGGLGSRSRLSLNGLSGDQVRVFVDAIPLEFAGFGIGLANISPNLIDRVEVYKGVVPVRFGSDALGGAVNLVTHEDMSDGLTGSASYQIGSFGTSRTTLDLQYLDPDTGIYASINGYEDYADNDYKVKVNEAIPGGAGKTADFDVKRFHDGYHASGGYLTLGALKKDWADLLELRLFNGSSIKEIQHNANMGSPYGEAEYKQSQDGFNLTHQITLAETVLLKSVVGDVKNKVDFLDVSPNIYNWFGDVVSTTSSPGEIGNKADNRVNTDSRFARFGLEWEINPDHALHLSLAPTYSERSGKSRLITSGIDRLTLKRKLDSFVSGIEHNAKWFDQRLETIIFIKQYQQEQDVEDLESDDRIVKKDRKSDVTGWGASLRYAITKELAFKPSYEKAVRLPNSIEVFGNGVKINPNLDIKEETSKNLNLSLQLQDLPTEIGFVSAQATVFQRNADDLIKQMIDGEYFQYRNVLKAQSKGLEASIGWSSLYDFITLNMNSTIMDLRNKSKKGDYAQFYNSRIPNTPYKFANASIQFKWFGLFNFDDEFSLTTYTRYVGKFDNGWEDQGLKSFKEIVPEQTSHALSLSYRRDFNVVNLNLNLEVQNLTDKTLYDYFGVQRPGRAYQLKTVIQF